MDMNLTKVVQVGELGVTVRELTVGEVRVLFKRLAEAGNPDAVSDTLLSEISLSDLEAMTNLTPAQIEDLTPSQLRRVFEVCREVNPDFFGLRDRVELLGRHLLEKLSSGSNGTPAV